VRRAFPAPATAVLVAVAALASPAAAVPPEPGELTGTTSQRHQGQRGTVHATVAPGARSLRTLVADALLRCDDGTVDARTFTATDVNVRPHGAFRARATFEQAMTSADGRPVTARFATRLKGRFPTPRRMTATLRARAEFVLDGAVYATCRSGTVRLRGRAISGSAPTAAAAPSA
jgi:hypothetical protein